MSFLSNIDMTNLLPKYPPIPMPVTLWVYIKNAKEVVISDSYASLLHEVSINSDISKVFTVERQFLNGISVLCEGKNQCIYRGDAFGKSVDLSLIITVYRRLITDIQIDSFYPSHPMWSNNIDHFESLFHHEELPTILTAYNKTMSDGVQEHAENEANSDTTKPSLSDIFKAASRYTPSEEEEKILAIMRTSSVKITRTYLEKGTGFSKNRIYRILSDLIKNNVIKRVEFGRKSHYVCINN